MDILWLGFILKTKIMIQEDLERDFLKDVIYLQERVLELEAVIMEEINRNEAIIKVVKDESKDNIQEIRDISPARVYVGYDLPFEDDSTGVRCKEFVRRDSQDMSTLSNNPQETIDNWGI
jgi:hypothetical protein